MDMVEVEPQRNPDRTSLPSPAAPAASSLKVAPAPAKASRKKWILGLALLVVLPLLGRGLYHIFFFESTDDAFLTSHIHTISARVPGYVQKVFVVENQDVKKGDTLVKLDPQDYELAVREAQAKYSRATKDVGRFRGFLAELNPADKKVFDEFEASALIGDAQLTRAQLQLQYTNLVAPENGKVGRVNVESGDMLQAGQALMALVENNPWVEANFKEGQVAHLKVGQRAEISIDAIPEKTFVGHIESIAPGSGSTFSLLPPDNATGNFTKIVQRIPVKITIDADSAKGFEERLVSGMSVEVSVKTK